MDKKIEAFRNEVLRWRGARKRGARPYTLAMKAKALQLLAGLRDGGLPMEAAARRVGITAATFYAWQKTPVHKGLVPVQLVPEARTPHAALPVRLLSPRGYRVEVADLPSAVALLRELG